MNRERLFPVLIGALGLMLGMWMIIDILSGNANRLGSLFLRLMIVGFLVGIVSPRKGVYLAIISTGYIDLFKRLMVTDYHVSYMDLYYVLGFTPVLVGAITLSVSIRYFTGQVSMPEAWKAPFLKIFILGVVAMLLNSLTAITYGSSIGGVFSNIANMAGYCGLIFVLPILFSKLEDIDKLMRFTLIAFIPAVLYMFKQAWFGLAGFEIDYLLTGLSLEQRIFNDEILRLFSTMNSAGNYSTIISVLGIMWLAPRINTRKTFFGLRLTPVSIFMCLLFLWSSYYTFSRGGWFCGLGTLIGLVFFRTRISTYFVTAAIGLSLVVLAFSSGYLLRSNALHDWTQMLSRATGGTQTSEMAVRLGTFGSRLESIDLTMTEPKRWTPFGVTFEGVDVDAEYRQMQLAKRMHAKQFRSLYYVHDGFSDLLLRFGYIPLSLILIVLGWGFWKVTKYIGLAAGTTEGRSLAWTLAFVVGLLIGYVANPAQVRTFPVNFYIYFGMGMLATVYLHIREKSTVGLRTESDMPDQEKIGSSSGELLPAN